MLAKLTRWGIDLCTPASSSDKPTRSPSRCSRSPMWWQRGRRRARLVRVLFGIPLACSLAVDILLGEIAHRRGRRTYGSVSGVK
ncbi:hypothetical protein [Streptomyces canarius]|uniref:hypothetical protein n=1 Tax=Streptomyces TaxID=1883 RepID=UPI001675CDD6